MKNFLKRFFKETIFVFLFCLIVAIMVFFDRGFATGLCLLLLFFIPIYIYSRKDKTLFALIVLTFLIHLVVIFVLYYTDFFPFSPGRDDIGYHKKALEIFAKLRSGDFSIWGMFNHYYPIFLAFLYLVTIPEMIVGQLFNVWLFCFSIIIIYLIILELGTNKQLAFLVGLLANVYPSYIFNGSLLLKDTLVVPLTLSGLFLIIKLIKKFNIKKLILFLFITAALITLRFYAGFALLLTFLISWFLFIKISPKKKLTYFLFLIMVFVFSLKILGFGWAGQEFFKKYGNPQYIEQYREMAYSEGTSTLGVKITFDNPIIFLKGFIQSFINVVFGPFPWQLKALRQFFVIGEIAIWFFLLPIVFKGIIIALKTNRFALPLIIFSFLLFSAIALIGDNIGTNLRIRMPAIIALFCLIPLGLGNKKLIFRSIKF